MLHELVLDLVEVIPGAHGAICLLLVRIGIVILVLVDIAEIVIFEVVVFGRKLLRRYLLVLPVAATAHSRRDALADACGAAIATEI